MYVKNFDKILFIFKYLFIGVKINENSDLI